MTWLRLARTALVATIGTMGAAQARDLAEGPLPCNSLCQRWMGITPEAAAPSGPEANRPLPPPQSILPSGVAQAGASPGKPDEAKTAAAKRGTPAIAVRVTPQRWIVDHTIPLPPRPTREPVAAPFGALAGAERFDRAIAALPEPPPAPHINVLPMVPSPTATPVAMAASVVAYRDMSAPEAVAVHQAATAQALASVEPSAVGVPASAQAPLPVQVSTPVDAALSAKQLAPVPEIAAVTPVPADPVPRVASAPMPLSETPVPVATRHEVAWPPPIDVIGAILLATPAAVKSADAL